MGERRGLRARMAAISQQGQEQIAANAKVIPIRAVLEAVVADPLREAMAAEVAKIVYQAYGDQLFGSGAVPDDVVGLDFGQYTATRQGPLPQGEHRTWGLQDLEEHGRAIAQNVGLPWQPILPPTR